MFYVSNVEPHFGPRINLDTCTKRISEAPRFKTKPWSNRMDSIHNGLEWIGDEQSQIMMLLDELIKFVWSQLWRKLLDYCYGGDDSSKYHAWPWIIDASWLSNDHGPKWPMNWSDWASMLLHQTVLKMAALRGMDGRHMCSCCPRMAFDFMIALTKNKQTKQTNKQQRHAHNHTMALPHMGQVSTAQRWQEQAQTFGRQATAFCFAISLQLQPML